MSRALMLMGLVGCGMALAQPPVDDRDAQPSSVDALAHGQRFHLTTRYSNPPTIDPRIESAPAIGLTLELELDAAWPGRRLTLSPHFPLTRAFAVTGDSWASLCESRGRARRAASGELLAYLGTWCALRTDRSAVAQLLPLISARAPELAGAARDDVADLLADERAPADAIAWLDTHRLLTADALDALATSYAASDQDDHARAVFEYLRSHEARASPAVACRRLQHEAAVSERATREQIGDELLAVSGRDPVCARIAAPLRCGRALGRIDGVVPCRAGALEAVVVAEVDRCRPYLELHPESKPAVGLLALRQHWPPSHAESCHWQAIGRFATESLSVAGADQLALAALDNGILDSACDASTRASIAALARVIQTHSSSHDARIAELASMTEDRCRTFRR